MKWVAKYHYYNYSIEIYKHSDLEDFYSIKIIHKQLEIHEVSAHWKNLDDIKIFAHNLIDQMYPNTNRGLYDWLRV